MRLTRRVATADWYLATGMATRRSRGFPIARIGDLGTGFRTRRRRCSSIDATQYVIGKGLVDPQRVCIYGSIFGAFAALQGTVLAPELFRCAVGYAGIYDLSLMPQGGGQSTSSFDRGYVETAVGTDPSNLKSASPAYNAAQIRAAVLLIHGLQDHRAPVEHAEKLKKALTESADVRSGSSSQKKDTASTTRALENECTPAWWHF